MDLVSIASMSPPLRPCPLHLPPFLRPLRRCSAFHQSPRAQPKDLPQFHLPDDPAQCARDKAMRATMAAELDDNEGGGKPPISTDGEPELESPILKEKRPPHPSSPLSPSVLPPSPALAPSSLPPGFPAAPDPGPTLGLFDMSFPPRPQAPIAPLSSGLAPGAGHRGSSNNISVMPAPDIGLIGRPIAPIAWPSTSGTTTPPSATSTSAAASTLSTASPVRRSPSPLVEHYWTVYYCKSTSLCSRCYQNQSH